MLTEWELWAVARAARAQPGARAELFLAERLGALALAGDEEGVEVWQAWLAQALRSQRRAARMQIGKVQRRAYCRHHPEL